MDMGEKDLLVFVTCFGPTQARVQLGGGGSTQLGRFKQEEWHNLTGRSHRRQWTCCFRVFYHICFGFPARTFIFFVHPQQIIFVCSRNRQLFSPSTTDRSQQQASLGANSTISTLFNSAPQTFSKMTDKFPNLNHMIFFA